MMSWAWIAGWAGSEICDRADDGMEVDGVAAGKPTLREPVRCARNGEAVFCGLPRRVAIRSGSAVSAGRVAEQYVAAIGATLFLFSLPFSPSLNSMLGASERIV